MTTAAPRSSGAPRPPATELPGPELHATYLLLLAACFLGTLPLEFVLHTRVYAQWRRLIGTLVPVVVIFGGWDLLAIHQHTWSYHSRYLLGLTLPGRVPLEELLFFLVIPTCAILAFEAVRARRPEWESP